MGIPDMINKKTVLVTIIILLCIFAPLTVVSYFLKEEKNPFDKNPHHDFYYKNMLWFYDEDDKLVNTFACTTDTCNYASSIIKDDSYEINYYKNGSLTQTSLINNDYAFIKDGALIKLFSVKQGSVLQNYKTINTYNTNIENNAYILENENNLWGVVSLKENIMSILPFEYSYIALKDNVVDGILSSKTFIVEKDDKWYLVGDDNTSLTSLYNEPIVDYNNRYVITKKEGRVRIYNYAGLEYLPNEFVSDYVLEGNYLGVISQNVFYLYNNLDSNYLKAITLNEEESNIEMEIDNNNIVIKSNGNVIDTLALTA